MPSRNTLVWIGATASAAVVAGASALYWTHPDFLWWNLARARAVATAPAEPKPPAVSTVPPVAKAQPQAPSVPAPVSKPNEAAAKPEEAAAKPKEALPPTKEAAASPTPVTPAFDVVNVDPSG